MAYMMFEMRKGTQSGNYFRFMEEKKKKKENGRLLLSSTRIKIIMEINSFEVWPIATVS